MIGLLIGALLLQSPAGGYGSPVPGKALSQLVLPNLPQVSVDLTLPTQGAGACPTLTTGSNCIRTPASGSATDFQNAMNAATCGDTIVLTAGSTYSGHFVVPPTSCSGWIEVVSSALGSLPAPGHRVSTSNLSNMAVVSTPSASYALYVNSGANHWRFIGIDFTTSFVSTVSTVSNIVQSDGDNDTSVSTLPSFIIIDRCLILGLSNANVTRGIDAEFASFALVDSYCDEIHSNSQDAQCVLAFNGPGPFLIQNNFLQASGENVMFGGSDPLIANLIPSDITIQGNLFQKNTSWRGQAAPLNWVVKNLFELKNAQRVLLDGNVLQDTWADAQYEAIIIRSVNQGGTCPWCVAQDVTVSHNIIQHAPMGVQIAPFETNNTPPTGRVLVQNNLLSDISNATWGNRGWTFEVSANASPNAHDIVFDHNTGFSDVAALEMDYDNPGSQITNFQFTNNLEDSGTSGVLTQASASVASFVSGTLSWNDIVEMNPTSTPAGQQPSGTSFNSITGAKFTSTSGTDPNLSGNFLLQGSSPYHATGTDGRDVGVWDWTVLNARTTAALNGTFTQ